MPKKVLVLAVAVCAFSVSPALAQAQAPATPAPAAPAAPAQGQAPARGGGGGQKVGQTGNPDPGVNFLNVVENPHVRVLQVTLQPGAVRRPHVHNDVTFHMLVPDHRLSRAHCRKGSGGHHRPGAGLLHGEGTDPQLHEQDQRGRSGDRALHQAGSGDDAGCCRASCRATRCRTGAGGAAG